MMPGPHRTTSDHTLPACPAVTRRTWSSLVTTIVILLVLVGVFARVVQLQLSPGDELRPFVTDRWSSKVVDPLRGDLRDRRGRVLATTRFEYRVVIDPVHFENPPKHLEQHPDESIVKLASIIGMPAFEVGERVHSRIIENARRRAVIEASKPETQPRHHDKRAELVSVIRTKLGWTGQPLQASPVSTPPEPDEPESANETKPLIRYVRIGDPIPPTVAWEVQQARLWGVYLERKPIRDWDDESVASIVGRVDIDHRGSTGLERALEDELRGSPGRRFYAADMRGRPLWSEANRREPAARGEDHSITIDLRIQRIAMEELKRGVEDADAAGGRVVVVDPANGAVLAMGDVLREVDATPVPWREPGSPSAEAPDMDGTRWQVIKPDPRRSEDASTGRVRCIEDLYEPGSTFKPFVWAHARHAGYAPDDELLTIKPGGRERAESGRMLEDVTKRTQLNWDEVLVYSSNIGMNRLTERMSHDELRGLIGRLGFGQRVGLRLPYETPGIVTSAGNWNKHTQTSLAMGYEIGVTPVQMARAFTVFARTGDLAGTLPKMHLVASDATDLCDQIIDPEVAAEVRTTLVRVAERMDSIRQRFVDDAKPAMYTMFGKSGTAEIACTPPPGMRRPKGFKGYFDNQVNSSFIAAGPASSPELVILVVIDDPGPTKTRINQHYGSWVAGPVVRRIMDRSLAYLGVEPDYALAKTEGINPGVRAR